MVVLRRFATGDDWTKGAPAEPAGSAISAASREMRFAVRRHTGEVRCKEGQGRVEIKGPEARGAGVLRRVGVSG